MHLRDIKLFSRCLISSLALLILIGAICLLGAFALSGNSSNIAIKIAVADNEDSVISRILINAVKGTDYFSKLMQISQMDEASAVASVEDGSSSAAIILPEDYLKDIAFGNKAAGKIYISDSIQTYSEMIASAAAFGEAMLSAAQQGVFTGEQFIREYSMGDIYHADYLRNANMTLINEAISASSRYIHTEELNYLDTHMTEKDYFVMCYILLFLFLIAISFTELFTKDMERGILARLSAYKVTCFKFFMPKIGMTFLLRLILMTVALLIIPMETGFNAGTFIYSCLTVLYVTVVTACISVCFGDSISSIAIVAIGGAFLCGAVIPRQLLPHAVTVIGDFTPFGGAKLLAEPIFGGQASIFTIIVPAFYLAAAVILINRKFRRVLTGGDA